MIAHLLTGIRLLLVPFSFLAFADRLPEEFAGGPFWPAIIMAVAILTDHLDGYVARSTGSASPAGQLFDHTTDFLFVAASLGGAAAVGLVPWALPALITLAYTQYVADSYLLDRRKELRMNQLGRWNGIFYFAPLVGIAFVVLPLAVFDGLDDLLLWLVVAVSWLLVASTVASMVDRLLAPRSGQVVA